MSVVNTFKIGADPEFAVVDKTGKHVNVKLMTDRVAPVAYDHEGDVLEVKPEPSKFAFRIVRRIQRLLKDDKVSKQIIEFGYNFKGGGRIQTPKRWVTMGGHVHFDLPYVSLDTWHKYGNVMNGKIFPIEYVLPSNKTIVNALDVYTTILEQLDILPKNDSAYRRRYSLEFGQLGAVRCANDANRWEYRSMCSWMHSPVAAMIALTGAKLIAAYPDLGMTASQVSVDELEKFFEKFRNKDVDAARLCEKVFEPKLKLEAQLDKNLQETWKSLKILGGSEKKWKFINTIVI